MRNPNKPGDPVEYCDLCCATPGGKLRWNEFAQPAKWDAPLKDGGPWVFVCERHKHAAYVECGKLLRK